MRPSHPPRCLASPMKRLCRIERPRLPNRMGACLRDSRHRDRAQRAAVCHRSSRCTAVCSGRMREACSASRIRLGRTIQHGDHVHRLHQDATCGSAVSNWSRWRGGVVGVTGAGRAFGWGCLVGGHSGPGRRECHLRRGVRRPRKCTLRILDTTCGVSSVMLRVNVHEVAPSLMTLGKAWGFKRAVAELHG